MSLAQPTNVCLNPGNAAPGAFTLDKPKTCVGTAVNVNATAQIGSPRYIFEYDGSSITGSTTFASGTSHTYTRPGSYTILQIGSNGQGSVACQRVDVVPTDPVRFTVKSCANRRVTITLDPATVGQYDFYLIRWGDQTQPQSYSRNNIPPHTYATSGTFTITVAGSYTTTSPNNQTVTLCSSPTTSQTAIVAASAGAATITSLYTSDANTTSIGYTAPAGVTVTLFRKDGANYVSTGQTATGPGEFRAQGNTSQVQCFKVQVQDECGTSAQSEEVCSMVLNVQVANNQNNLSWQAYAGTGTQQFRGYRVIRSGSETGAAITNRATTTYQDRDIVCGQQYCYSVMATLAGTPEVTITSNLTCVIGTNTDPPAAPTNVRADVQNNRPVVFSTQPAGNSYTMVITNAASGQVIAELDRRNQYTDTTVSASTQSYCYRVAFRNSCGLTSTPSEPVCTVHLGSQSATGIDWTTASPFWPSTVARYVVEVIDSVDGTQREIEKSLLTHHDIDLDDPRLQSQRFRIVTISSNGVRSYSNFFTIKQDARILVPDAFTPNGDGINDEFLAKGIYVDQFNMTIYSRWGEVIYSTTDKKKGWDGNANGQIAASGQYMYRIEMTDLLGKKTVRTGALLLIR
ncbi:hypothetical protein GCM10028807_26990 [Spirosoma daeguense]